MKSLLIAFALLFCLGCGADKITGAGEQEPVIVTVYLDWTTASRGSDLYIYADGDLAHVMFQFGVATDTMFCEDGAALHATWRSGSTTKELNETARNGMTWHIQ